MKCFARAQGNGVSHLWSITLSLCCDFQAVKTGSSDPIQRGRLTSCVSLAAKSNTTGLESNRPHRDTPFVHSSVFSRRVCTCTVHASLSILLCTCSASTAWCVGSWLRANSCGYDDPMEKGGSAKPVTSVSFSAIPIHPDYRV